MLLTVPRLSLNDHAFEQAQRPAGPRGALTGARAPAPFTAGSSSMRARGALADRGGGALGTLGGTWAHGWSRGSVARVDGSGRENLGGKGEKFLATLGYKCAQFGTFRALTAVIFQNFSRRGSRRGF